jgi:hypothetical protein
MFAKRPGTLNRGKKNEELNLANLMLKLTVDDNVKDFTLSSDDSKFGDFDDIVCEVQTSREKFKYAIQIKHVNDEQKKKLKIMDLQKKIGKFSLLTFYKHYLEVEDVCELFDLILYTNQKFDFNTEEEKITLDDGNNKFDVMTTKCEAHPWLSTNESNCCYKFKIIENHDDTTKLKKYELFFGNFYLYVEQMNVEQLEEHIFGKFKKEFCCENDNELKKYLHFVESWKDREQMKKKLSKTVMKNVLLFNLFGENIRPPMVSKERVNAKIRVLREAILKFDVTIFGKKNEDLVKSIWAFDSNELLNAKAQELAVDYQLTFNDQTVLLWLMGRYPLLVVDTVVTRKAINLSGSKKFVLFSDNDNIDDFTNLSVLRKLSDLEKHPEIYKTVVDTFCCAIQLKTNAFPLRKILRENKIIQVIVTTDKLLSMINDPLVICPDNEILPPLYITRDVSRNIIHVKCFEKMDEDTLVLISCWKKNSKLLEGFRIVDVEELMKNDEYGEESGRIVCVSQSEGSLEEFEECCTKMKKLKAHHFAMTEREQLEWVRSKHGVEDLKAFRVDRGSMEESELLRYENNINIVCAESGMGKTELMKSVKNKSCYNSWTIMIYARNHYQHFRQKKNDVQAFKEYIIDRIYKRYEEFDVKFLKMLIIETKSVVVRYIWDGLDEVSSENLKIIKKLIRDLSAEGSKHWITSRNILKKDLEQYFKTFSRTIKEFHEEQQQDYIEKKLAHLSHTLKDISKNIITTIRLSSSEGVLGIPLLVYILTELFKINGSGTTHEWLTKGSFSIAKLYQHFVEQKFCRYYMDKLDWNSNNEGQMDTYDNIKKERIQNYEKIATKMYFEKEIVSNKMSLYVDDFLSRIKFHGDPVGIITRIVDSNYPVFLHNSFTDYFAGSYLAKNDPLGERFNLNNKNYKNILIFRNLILNK